MKKFDFEIFIYLYVFRSPEFIYAIFAVMYANEHDNVQTVHSIKLKFGMYITGLRRTNFIDFGECQMHSFFTGVQKRFLKHYDL